MSWGSTFQERGRIVKKSKYRLVSVLSAIPKVFQKLKIDLFGIRICHVSFGTIQVTPLFFVAIRVVLRYSNTRNGRLSLYLRLEKGCRSFRDLFLKTIWLSVPCCELTVVKNLPLGIYDRLYWTVSRELSPMSFSEALPVEFLKVGY